MNNNVTNLTNLEFAKSVSPDDTIYYIDNTGKNIKLVQVKDLLPYFISNEQYTNLIKKYNELNNLYNDFKSFITNNYPTITYFNNTYSSKEFFNKYYNELITIYSVLSNELDEYCSKKYEEYLNANALVEFDTANKETIDDLAGENVGLIGPDM